MDYKVYVTLGFHVSFYHSWRGDTPDEAGFGTDIRVIREALKILNRANQMGLKARGYWDAEVYWTFQEILPKHSPDILEGIRRRVEAGLDEIILGPFNNGANHAATADEFRSSVAWAIENEWGSGLRQLFGKAAPYYRPQETMFTTGQESMLRECGVDGLLLYYAGVPFNTISSFIPALSNEQRYNPLWFHTREDQPLLLLLPCIAAGDLFEQVSLENLMLDLHKRQRDGEIQTDVLININEDADLETWLPIKLPKALAWLPNTGGLEEFIRVVNKYPWADFTLPSEYVASHPPRGEVLVRQDLADGGFDGNYSWAEKSASLRAWTLLEQSRLASYRADTLAKRAGLDLEQSLWDGMDSSFFQRLIGLSTTHFGMSTPIISEERQDKAYAILGRACQIAEDAERVAARACKQESDPASLYELELYLTPPARGVAPAPARSAVSLPIVLPAGVEAALVEDGAGNRVRASLTDVVSLPGGQHGAQVRFVANLDPAEPVRIRIQPSAASPAPIVKRLKNQWLDVAFSEENGIEHFTCNGEAVGAAGFLAPFVTYQRRTFHASKYSFEALDGEMWDGLQRVRLKTRIPMQTPEGEFTSNLAYTFSLFDCLPYLYVDVEACYAYTPPRQVIHNMTQKLRRLIDLNWVETAPFQLTPELTASVDNPLRVWKHNYLGITAYFDLNYGHINPHNHSLDSFNHAVTAGWVAISNQERGLLLGENAHSLASMAFCPMRLHEHGGVQSISLNPFGSYYGRQFDYSHLGGNGNGKVIMQVFSGALHPNGPSFNGETLRFSLLLAPYSGDEPPQELQNDAAAHFYPPGAILHTTPEKIEAGTVCDIERYIASEQQRAQLEGALPPSPPTAFLVNPSPNAVDLVWDAPRDGIVTGYEIHWRAVQGTDWRAIRIAPLTRWRLDGLVDGQPMYFKMRALRGDACSAWTSEQACTPGAVTESHANSMLGLVPAWTLLRIFAASIWAALRAAISDSKQAR
ncbi:MAG: fibronectin type III domain-containing protein [Anaerolineales bacterium]|nr:fibronectin type III domain-containing protein [Anaerolineales bacterium]